MIIDILITAFGSVAVFGLLYHTAAMLSVWIHFRRRRDKPTLTADQAAPVSVLKPVCGDEQGLREALGSFCDQDYGDYEVLFGAATLDDAGLQVARHVGHDHETTPTRTCAPVTAEGMNAKVCNLEMLADQARHDMLVISDSDIVVQRDYLAHIMQDLSDNDGGAVTCAYLARPTDSFWARMGAMGVNFAFLPSVVFSHRAGLVKSAYGGTIALTRQTLSRFGGFAAFRDALADDYEIARAVPSTGGRLILSPYLVESIFAETSYRELLDKEVRWARTIRSVQPVGYVMSVVTNLTLFGVLTAIVAGGGNLWLAFAGLCLAVRYLTAFGTAKALGIAPPRPDALLLRDLQSLLVYGLSFTGRTVVWRGRRMQLLEDGVLATETT